MDGSSSPTAEMPTPPSPAESGPIISGGAESATRQADFSQNGSVADALVNTFGNSTGIGSAEAALSGLSNGSLIQSAEKLPLGTRQARG